MMSWKIVIGVFSCFLSVFAFADTGGKPELVSTLTSNSVSVISQVKNISVLNSEEFDDRLAEVIEASAPFRRVMIGGTEELPGEKGIKDRLIYYFLKPGIRNVPEILITLKRSQTDTETKYELVSPVHFYGQYLELSQRHFDPEQISFSLKFTNTQMKSNLAIRFPQFIGWLQEFLRPVKFPKTGVGASTLVQMESILQGMQSMLKSIHLKLVQ